MKFSKLAALVREHQSATLLDDMYDGDVVRQHVVVGGAIFPLDGFPVVDKEALLTMMDIPNDKHAEYFIQRAEHTERTRMYTSDFGEKDQPARILGITIAANNRVLNVLETEGGEIVFVDNAYRKVLGDEKQLEWWVRDVGSGCVVVDTRGYQFVGCMPVERAWVDDYVVDHLADIAVVAARMNEAKKAEEKNRDGEQQRM